MQESYKKYKVFFIILFLVIAGFFVWYFLNIIIMVIVAGIISIIGSPLVKLMDRIHIWKIKFPHFLSVILSLLLIIVIVLTLFSFFIPLLFREAHMISSIDGKKLAEYFHPQLQSLQEMLVRYGLIRPADTVEIILRAHFAKVINFGLFSNILGGLITFTGNFIFHLFATIFLSFFFLLDTAMLPRFILILINEKYRDQTKNVMQKSKKLLSRYFRGLSIQILANIATYTIALYIIGVKGAFVIAFFAGIIIIIPYLGGIIAIITGILLGVTGVISMGDYAHIMPMAFRILIAMIVCQLIDNNIFQPFIQGRSMKTHPVEIFLVIIIAASIGGIPAMIVAVPLYAFLRIVATEFLSQFRVIREMDHRISG